MHPMVRRLLSGAVVCAMASGTLLPLAAQAATVEVPAQVTRSDVAVQLFELAGSPAGSFPTAGFADVTADHPRATVIDWLAATGITTGRADGSFGPDAALSRAANATMLYRLAGSPPGPFPDAGFTDVGLDSAHATAIDWLAHTGLTLGRGDGTFGSTASVTRTQTATFAARFTASPLVTVDVPDVAIPTPPPPSTPRPPAATVPSAPTHVTVTPAQTQLTVTWQPPTKDGGAHVTGYTITVTPDGATTTTDDATATISGLATGTVYTVAVVATNAVGNSIAATTTAATLQPATFLLADNNVTVRCPDAAVGDTGDVNGITYTKRTREQISVDNAAATCTSGITDMSRLFSSTAFNGDISHWDTSAVTAMNSMFEDAAAFNQDIGDWNTSHVTTTRLMFANAEAFNQDIGDWDTSSVTDMWGTFQGAATFDAEIGRWDASGVTEMSFMFSGAGAFDRDIGLWDTSAVANMIYMFSRAGTFNQDLSGWCVQQIPSEPSYFKTSAAWTEPQPNWGLTC